eukprot:TRINITY_DN6334_c0_g1_i2.p1 TRINITY_DN6334_c0_g1~~TRINITY_DN6334_c0_g1_i2.p1  ORF type:complete len:162 (-),score=42.30 TRINITY_DN6334_c0_g1_i2:131-616(-)
MINFFFFFKQKTAYEIGVRLVGSEMCIRDRALEMLSNFNVSISEVEHLWREEFTIDPRIQKHLETECRYKVYLEKQIKEIEGMKKNQYRADISEMDFETLRDAISPEEIEKLKSHKPNTIFAASRIPGIRPTTLIYLHQFVRKTLLRKNKMGEDESPELEM